MQSKMLKGLLEGMAIKRPAWEGYWQISPDRSTILMYCRDGEVLDIRETKRVFYTLDNILADDWVEATIYNCPLLGGLASINYISALQYLFRGIPIYNIDKNTGLWFKDSKYYNFVKVPENCFAVDRVFQSLMLPQESHLEDRYILVSEEDIKKSL